MSKLHLIFCNIYEQVYLVEYPVFCKLCFFPFSPWWGVNKLVSLIRFVGSRDKFNKTRHRVITSTALFFSSQLKLIRQACHVTVILQSAKSSVLKILLCQKASRLLQSADTLTLFFPPRVSTQETALRFFLLMKTNCGKQVRQVTVAMRDSRRTQSLLVNTR